MTEPVFRSLNHYFEWNEDDQGNRQQVVVPEPSATMPKDDVLERLKRREAGIGEGVIAEAKARLASGDNINRETMLSFKDVLLKTIGEYQEMVDASKYKDEQDKARLESTIKELKKQLAILQSKMQTSPKNA